MSGALTRYAVDEHGVALLQLDRPERRNAINRAMLRELLEHLRAAGDDGAVRVLVISSTDHMALSAGADIREQVDRAGVNLNPGNSNCNSNANFEERPRTTQVPDFS